MAESTQTDAGALLLLPPIPPGRAPRRGPGNRRLAEHASAPYHRVSNFLASTVLREGEAVLARNVVDDSTLGSRDSQGEILATSVICARSAAAAQVFGLVHSIRPTARCVPDPDDLEFTLAVADTVAVALENISRRQELAENLTRVRSENVAAARAAGRAAAKSSAAARPSARSPRKSPGPPPARPRC